LFSAMLLIFAIKVACVIKHLECNLISWNLGLNS
jgi:hypothetical protein